MSFRDNVTLNFSISKVDAIIMVFSNSLIVLDTGDTFATFFIAGSSIGGMKIPLISGVAKIDVFAPNLIPLVAISGFN